MRASAVGWVFLVSLSSAAGIAWSVAGVVWPEHSWDLQERRRVQAHARELLKRGKLLQPDRPQWPYGDDVFWQPFEKVPFTGARPKKGGGGPVLKKKRPAGPGEFDLSEKILVVCITYGGDYTQVVVDYMGNGAGAHTGVAGVLRMHHLGLGEPLREPFRAFVLVDVAPDASLVTFEDRGRTGPEGEHPRHVVTKQELSLTADNEAVLGGILAGATGKGMPGAAGNGKRAAGPTAWVDVPVTRRNLDGEWIVSRDHLERLRKRGNRVVHQDIRLRDVNTGSGANRVQGVAVLKLGPLVRKVGLLEGDVVTTLNGIPVRSRARALRLAKRLYREGVRTFRLQMLRRGQELRPVVYHLPPDK